MIRHAAKELGRESIYGAPPLTVTIGTLAGLPLQQWVYIVTILYTLILIGKQFPKLYGCAVCFRRNRTCNRSCKD